MRQAGLISRATALAVAGSVGAVSALAAEGEISRETACGTSGPELAIALDSLRRVCPSPPDGLSDACMAALQERFWNKPVLCHAHASPRGLWKPLWLPQPTNDLLLWREVFEDPSALRAEVQAAVRSRACRLRANEFQPQLRRACAADAMARLGALHGACQYSLYVEGDRRHEEWEPEGAEEGDLHFKGWRTYWQERRAEVETLENESYWRTAALQEEAELHHAWRMARCRAVPEAALAPLRELRPPSVYAGSPIDQRDLLIVAAARLGSEWAIAVGTWLSRAGSGGDVAVETWRDAPLALAYVHWSQQHGPAYLLAARQIDLASDAPRFDWRGWERGFADAYGADRVAAAGSTARTVRARGWPPCCARELGNSPWPWADLPTPVRTKVVRRRIDASGNIRWVYENGREEWVEGDAVYTAMPGQEPWIAYHARVGRVALRRWIDGEGIERWLDEWGDEHWIEADGTERWVDLDGTEWILLPPERTAEEDGSR